MTCMRARETEQCVCLKGYFKEIDVFFRFWCIQIITLKENNYRLM